LNYRNLIISVPPLKNSGLYEDLGLVGRNVALFVRVGSKVAQFLLTVSRCHSVDNLRFGRVTMETSLSRNLPACADVLCDTATALRETITDPLFRVSFFCFRRNKTHSRFLGVT